MKQLGKLTLQASVSPFMLSNNTPAFTGLLCSLCLCHDALSWPHCPWLSLLDSLASQGPQPDRYSEVLWQRLPVHLSQACECGVVSDLLEESKWGAVRKGGEASGGGEQAGGLAGSSTQSVCYAASARPVFIYAARIFIPTPFSVLLQETARIVTYLAA